MRTKKLASLAALVALATLFVSSVAKADVAATSIRASGALVDGTGTNTTGAIAMLTTADGDDEGTAPDPVAGVPIVFKIGNTVVCDGASPDHPTAMTNAYGEARCGLLLNTADLAAAGGKYSVSFAGNDFFAASTDTAGLVYHSAVGDVPA